MTMLRRTFLRRMASAVVGVGMLGTELLRREPTIGRWKDRPVTVTELHELLREHYQPPITRGFMGRSPLRAILEEMDEVSGLADAARGAREERAALPGRYLTFDIYPDGKP